MKIDTIVVHHSGGLQENPNASTAWLTVGAIDRSHQARWPNFKSEMGFWVGYNFVILPNGEVTQTRLVGEETAHTIGMNTRSIGICIIGNANSVSGRPIDTITPEAIKSYRQLIKDIENKNVKIKDGTNLDISRNRIYPHRAFSQTDCYGTYYSDSWCRDILRDKPKLSINVIIQIYLLLKKLHGEQRALSELKKIISAIGSIQNDRDCSGNI